MKSKRIRLAIVGCGAITESGHLPAAMQSPRIDVSALVDLNLENANAMARQYGLSCLVTDDLEQALDRCEGALIATPNKSHLDVASRVLSRGLPVLVEKPIATSYGDAIAMCELAERHNTFISVGYRSRHWPNVQLLRQLLDKRYLGDLRRFHYEFGTSQGWSPVSGFNLDPTVAGGGVLIDTHMLDKILYWFGDPKNIDYYDDNMGGVEASCKARMSFDSTSGAVEGTIFISRSIPLKNQIEIESDRYLCTISENENQEIVLVSNDFPDLVHHLRSPALEALLPENDFQSQLDEFASNITDSSGITVDGRWAAKSVKLMEEMYASRKQLEETWKIYNSSRVEITNG